MIWQVHSITGTPVPDISFLLALLVLLLYKGCLVRNRSQVEVAKSQLDR